MTYSITKNSLVCTTMQKSQTRKKKKKEVNNDKDRNINKSNIDEWYRQ